MPAKGQQVYIETHNYHFGVISWPYILFHSEETWRDQFYFTGIASCRQNQCLLSLKWYGMLPAIDGDIYHSFYANIVSYCRQPGMPNWWCQGQLEILCCQTLMQYNRSHSPVVNCRFLEVKIRRVADMLHKSSMIKVRDNLYRDSSFGL